MPSNTDKAYVEYIQSDAWKTKRLFALHRAAYKCEKCGATEELEVHHKTYDRFGGEEKQSDLAVLCKRCHKKADQQRRYNKALSTWATKKYGEYWDEQESEYDTIREEFDAWLQRKQLDKRMRDLADENYFDHHAGYDPLVGY